MFSRLNARRPFPSPTTGTRAEHPIDVAETVGLFWQLPGQGRTTKSLPRGRSNSLLAVGIALSALGCSVETEDFSSDESVGSVHAVARVRRVEMLGGPEETLQHQGEALAAFVRVPPSVLAEQVLHGSSLWPQHPEVGQCLLSTRSPEIGWAEDVSGELISADSLEFRTSQGVHPLAPHAFPSAYDLLRGMVFSSRDQSALGLPEDDRYVLVGSGVELPQAEAVNVVVTQASPRFPQGVQVSNQPFEDVASLAAQAVLDFSWQAHPRSDDLIVVSIAGEAAHYQCAFTDAEGFGSVPLTTSSGQSVWTVGTSAQLSIHRIRETSEPHPDLAQIKVGFDFSIERSSTLVHPAP